MTNPTKIPKEVKELYKDKDLADLAKAHLYKEVILSNKVDVDVKPLNKYMKKLTRQLGSKKLL